MDLIKYAELDCETFGDYARKHGGVVVTEIEDLTGKIPHVGYGGGSKSSYVSPKSGKTIYVLERNGWYTGDAFANDVWQFAEDFTASEAAEYITAWDAQHGR